MITPRVYNCTIEPNIYGSGIELSYRFPNRLACYKDS
jgi:hypothetical protein